MFPIETTLTFQIKDTFELQKIILMFIFNLSYATSFSLFFVNILELFQSKFY